MRTEIYGLAVSKTASTAAVTPGDLLTYTLTVTNLHPSAATYHLVLSDTLPAGTQFVTATVGYTLSGDQVSWNLDHAGSRTAPGRYRLPYGWIRTPRELSAMIDYAVRSDEVTPPVTGKPVETLIRREVWLPLLYWNTLSADLRTPNYFRCTSWKNSPTPSPPERRRRMGWGRRSEAAYRGWVPGMTHNEY